MKTYMLPIAIVAFAVSAAAGAQTPPTSPTSPADTSSAAPAPSSTSSSSYSNGMSDSKAQLKECVAKQKASNAQLSDADAKRACEKSDSTK